MKPDAAVLWLVNPECEANADGVSIQERRGGAMMRLRRALAPQARRAISGARSSLFELQGATGESGKVR